MSRSASRGRETLTSSGRGGAGNFVRRSSIDARPEGGSDDFSPTRGREQTVHPDKIWTTGRGGAGNISSPSRDPAPAAGPDEREREVIRQGAQRETFSTGRGGAGNMSRSRSRSRGPNTTSGIHSVGRGGLGNFKAGEEPPIEEVDYQDSGVHSTGRGGFANHVHSPPPGVEHHYPPHQQSDFVSTGRGGRGNLVDRSRSASRDPQHRSPSKDKEGGVTGLLHKIGHLGSKDPSHTHPSAPRESGGN
ncbi:hypothetical protein K435DRAFT_847197 [Dendrothele bispora CBS 962.96]|uniref:Uncharacterized protein n=1 Tax=Dendrothele bispora (strain CBS 962.96) TaxID=1314807 RepID=A0A4S8MY10_DENBC|nr:hypothetical protein K435DRAFT_847197 [Dendrothele bispora CBS 962.96]